MVLSRSASDAISGKPLSDAESGSEWETDVDEDMKSVSDGDAQMQETGEGRDGIIEVETTAADAPSSSYSSILKTTKQPEAEER